MKHRNLQTRLLFRLFLILGGCGLLFVIGINHHLRALAEAGIADKSRLIFASLTAVQTYVRGTLRPAMYDTLPKGSFLIEAMSTSFVTRKVLTDLNMAKDQFVYRRVALDPRNPEFGANEMEQGYIARFRAAPEVREISEFRTFGGEEYYVTARPAVFEQNCLVCHGDPADAPEVMLARYGRERGFGRTEGEIGGLDVLLLSVNREFSAIRDTSVTFLVVVALGALLILGAAHFFSDRIIVQNIGRLADLLRARFPAEADKALRSAVTGGAPSQEGRDEIEDMINDIERFADHLREAKAQLREYAATLEDRVAERTAALSIEAEARRRDVRLFVRMLGVFAKGLDRRGLVLETLEAIARRFGAEAAGFVCFISSTAHGWPSVWPEPDPKERSELLEGRSLFCEHAALVPVVAGETVRGALGLRWSSPQELTEQTREVIQALGQQLGIAMENIESLENTLRQKAVLESIFEGIADPLFLLDPAGAVVYANESGRTLQAGLADQPAGFEEALGLAELVRAAASPEPEQGGAAQREALLPGGRTLSLRAYPLRAQGLPDRTILWARDTSVEKTMLARLQQGEKALAVGELAAGLAHEINNPLGTILCYARLLWDDGRSPQAADLDVIIRHTLHAQKVLLDLMRFARPKPTQPGPVDLASAAEFLVRVFARKAQASGILIRLDFPADLPPALADATAVEQILTNLLLNALDALDNGARTGESPTVSVTAGTSPSGGEVWLRVADNGPGIPPEHLPRIFDPFFTTKEVGKGSGLGLAVVYGLARDLGGRVEAGNDGGAALTVHFKTAGAHDAQTA